MRHALAIASTLAALAACGGGGDSSDAATGGSAGAAGAGGKKPVAEPFIALERDFQGYEAWTMFDQGHQEGDPNFGEPPGVRQIFVNAMPGADATKFPIGTIIVKEIIGDTPTDSRIFAMAKRGAGYNAIGAVNWEWFELVKDADERITIMWRGVAPPPGQGYGTSLNGSCNVCHGSYEANDFVQTPALTLGKLGQ